MPLNKETRGIKKGQKIYRESIFTEKVQIRLTPEQKDFLQRSENGSEWVRKKIDEALNNEL